MGEHLGRCTEKKSGDLGGFPADHGPHTGVFFEKPLKFYMKARTRSRGTRRTAPWSSPCSVPRLSRLWISQQEAAFPRPVPKAPAKLQGKASIACGVSLSLPSSTLTVMTTATLGGVHTECQAGDWVSSGPPCEADTLVFPFCR